jgi:hypothetical protein
MPLPLEEVLGEDELLVLPGEELVELGDEEL